MPTGDVSTYVRILPVLKIIDFADSFDVKMFFNSTAGLWLKLLQVGGKSRISLFPSVSCQIIERPHHYSILPLKRCVDLRPRVYSIKLLIMRPSGTLHAHVRGLGWRQTHFRDCIGVLCCKYSSFLLKKTYTLGITDERERISI